MAHLIKENNNWVIRDDWHEIDVRDVAKNLKVKLTKDQVYKVMQVVVKGFDANEGISWYSIESAIDFVTRG
jgi:uncharacterized protein YpuA (DUF1002 family)